MSLSCIYVLITGKPVFLYIGLSHNFRKHTLGHVRQAKIQIILSKIKKASMLYLEVQHPIWMFNHICGQHDPRFFTAVVRAWLGSYVGKPSSAYGWSGGFSPDSPVYARLR